jgi:GNAT superfamily N-acetyltransferase
MNGHGMLTLGVICSPLRRAGIARKAFTGEGSTDGGMIRQATPSDLDGLVPLFDAYRAFFAGPKPVASRTFLAQRLHLGDAAFFIASAQERPIGFLTLYPLFSSWHAKRIWFLSDLYVDTDHRGAGIGRSLVEQARHFATESGSRSIMVEIPHSEPHLVRFYEALSFVRDRDFSLYRCYLD